MKNFYFCLILFFLILSGSLVSNIYVKNQMTDYKTYFYSLLSETPAKAATQTGIIKEKFYKQKNMLQLFVNKEHIKELETSILLIEKSVENDSLSDNSDKLIETICLVSQIIDYTTAIN